MLHFTNDICGIHHLTPCPLIGFGRNIHDLVALPSLSIVNFAIDLCSRRRPPPAAGRHPEKRSDLQVATASFRKSMVYYILQSNLTLIPRGLENQLNQTMTCSSVVRRWWEIIGESKTRTCHAEGLEHGRKPKSPDQHATRNRLIRWSCPCFPCKFELEKCHVAPRGIHPGVSVSTGRTNSFSKLSGNFHIRPNRSERNRRRSNPPKL